MKIVVILGPTGVGKTSVSVKLAKDLNAEIINADATQVYKEVSIGTAKVTEEEKQGIKHHMLDVVSINENYSVNDYQRDARKVLDELIKKDKNVIIVGGSGLYIKALLYDYNFKEETGIINYDGFSNEELKSRVDEIYKDNDIHVNNRKRLERFLSHYDLTGEIIKNTDGKDKPLYDFTLIGLTTDKEKLYEHINKRVEIMVCDGFIEEARNLHTAGVTKARNLIGYKEFFDYFDGAMELRDSIETTKARTRKYAKRQYTWFNNQFDNVTWFDVLYDNIDETIKKIEGFIS